MQEPSIFTKIINGEIPSHNVYEDEKTIAFMNIHPSQPGHVLIVPKLQVVEFHELPDDDYRALMMAVKKVAQQIKAVLNPVRVGVKVIGLDVPHVHIHLIPFNTADEFYVREDMDSEPDHQALAAMASKLRFDV